MNHSIWNLSDHLMRESFAFTGRPSHLISTILSPTMHSLKCKRALVNIAWVSNMNWTVATLCPKHSDHQVTYVLNKSLLLNYWIRGSFVIQDDLTRRSSEDIRYRIRWCSKNLNLEAEPQKTSDKDCRLGNSDQHAEDSPKYQIHVLDEVKTALSNKRSGYNEICRGAHNQILPPSLLDGLEFF